MTLHPDQRQELAAGLRALRVQAGVSTHQLAAKLGWYQNKVSRLDRGVSLAKPDDVDAWTRALSAPADERRRLVALAEKAGARFTEWRQQMAPGRRRVQAEIGALESTATTLWEFSMDVVPGLMQTPTYAEVMFRLSQDDQDGSEDIADVVQARMARQSVLADPTKRFRMLCVEAAFRRNLLDRGDWLAQIDRVLEVAALPNVEFGVVPLRARERTHHYHTFAVIGDPAVDPSAIALAETVTRGLTIRDPEEIAGYLRHYQQIAEQAVTGSDLPAYLREVAANSPWS